MEIHPKFLTKEQINQEAEKFLREYHPTLSIPLPIEEIIDLKLQINIIPIPGLKDSFIKAGLNIDAFISPDFKSITVDKFLSNPNKINVRYNFSLAHEIGHMVLHGYLFEDLKFNSIDEWIDTLNTFPASELRTVEWQADEFAGLVLVPRRILKAEFKKAIKKAEKLLNVTYADKKDFVFDTAIECYLAPQFNVSQFTAKIRIERDGLVE